MTRPSGTSVVRRAVGGALRSFFHRGPCWANGLLTSLSGALRVVGSEYQSEHANAYGYCGDANESGTKSFGGAPRCGQTHPKREVADRDTD